MTAPREAAGASGSLAAGWYALTVLVAAYLIAYVDKQILSIAAQPIARALAMSDPQIGLMQGLGAAVFAPLAMLPIGWLSDRVRRPLVLALGIVIWSTCLAFCGLATSFPQILGAAIGIAIGEAVLSPVAYSLIPEVFPRRLWVTANIIFFAAALFGISIGLAVASGVMDAFAQHPLSHNGAAIPAWRSAVAAVAAPGVVLALAALTIRTPRRAAPGAPLGPTVGLTAFVRATWRGLAPLLFGKMTLQAALGASYSWLALALARRFDITPSAFGYQLSLAIGAGSLLGVCAAYFASRRFRSDQAVTAPVAISIGSFLAAALVAGAYFWVIAPWQAAVVTAAIFALAMGSSSLLPGILQVMTPDPLRGRVSAASAFCSAVGVGLGPLLVGAASGSSAFRGDVLGAVAAVNILFWLVGAAAMWLSLKTLPAVAGKLTAAASPG